MKGAVSDFAPDMVLIPHPADTHTDHSATYAFAMYALEQLEQVTSGQCRVMCYVVHSGLDWPDPWAYRPDHPLTPPGRAQPAIVWTSVPLSAGAQEAKYRALKQYAGQLTFSASFLRSLVRTNELFAEVPGFNLTECAESAAQCAPLGQPAGSPVRETARLFRPGGEIKSTVVSRVHGGLLVTVDLAGRRSDSLQYQLTVAPSVPADPVASIVHPLRYGPVHTGDRSKQVRFLLSPEQLGDIGARALFEVVTMRGSRVLDRSGWFRVIM